MNFAIKNEPPPTKQQLLDACISNLRAAQSKEADVRKRWDVLLPGESGFDDCKYALAKAIAETRHWHSYVEHYRREVEAMATEDY